MLPSIERPAGWIHAPQAVHGHREREHLPAQTRPPRGRGSLARGSGPTTGSASLARSRRRPRRPPRFHVPSPRNVRSDSRRGGPGPCEHRRRRRPRSRLRQRRRPPRWSRSWRAGRPSRRPLPVRTGRARAPRSPRRPGRRRWREARSPPHTSPPAAGSLRRAWKSCVQAGPPGPLATAKPPGTGAMGVPLKRTVTAS